MGKGSFGQFLEKLYFGYNPNSSPKPDFEEVGIELKSSPLKYINKNTQLVAKERLVLNIINYDKLIDQKFETSDFWKKNNYLLLVFFLHKTDISVLDFVIKIVGEWRFPIIDLTVIQRDWLIIQGKVQDGIAHEISEGDTFYLGACTKGANSNSLRRQPNSALPAMQRAFSLKQGYLNNIIATLSSHKTEKYGRLITNPKLVEKYTIEEIVTLKFIHLLGLGEKDLIKKLKIDSSKFSKSKNYHSRLVKLILNSIFEVPIGKSVEKYIEEFAKSDIIIKTVRLKSNNRPAESTSLPAFKYEEIYAEEWNDSELKGQLESKYLFVFFKYDLNNNLYLESLGFWKMNYTDLQSANKTWDTLKLLISKGNIVKEISRKGNKISRKTTFPAIKSNAIHIRPHATNSYDTFPLPVRDKVSSLEEYTKHSFWFSGSYIRDEIHSRVLGRMQEVIAKCNSI